MVAKPSVADLSDAGRYHVIGEMDLKNPTPFFREHAKGSWVVGAFILLISLSLGVLAGFTGARAASQPAVLWQGLLALAVVFGVLLPLHEGIHALVYKGMGAADIRFSFAAKALAVYTCANRHVVHLREIIPLAIAPFLAISALLVVLAGYFPDYRLFFAWALV
ncbi:MAG: DUF3267 domain-containing protein, partial [Ferruginibacter sp.]|nr:DUF3267 domain-containing protein [Cytophagales bacterium]